MPTQEKINAFLDGIIAVGEVVAPRTPWAIDDLTIDFVKWARNNPKFQAFLERFNPPAPGSFTAPPTELIELLNEWQAEREEARILGGGRLFEIIAFLMQIAELFKKTFPSQPA